MQNIIKEAGKEVDGTENQSRTRATCLTKNVR